MDIEVSTNTSRLARQAKLSPDEMAFADLLACGWPVDDAWAVAIRKGVSWTKQARKHSAKELSEKQAVKERVEKTKSVLRSNHVESVKKAVNSERQDIVSAAMSKEQMLFDLQTSLEGKTPGSSEWIKIKQLIVDVTRMKQDEVRDEETTIHHYLPVDYPVSCEYCLRSRCNECRFKKAYEEKGTENPPTLQ